MTGSAKNSPSAINAQAAIEHAEKAIKDLGEAAKQASAAIMEAATKLAMKTRYKPYTAVGTMPTGRLSCGTPSSVAQHALDCAKTYHNEAEHIIISDSHSLYSSPPWLEWRQHVMTEYVSDPVLMEAEKEHKYGKLVKWFSE